MKQNDYIKICDYLQGLIEGTPYENKVYVCGGAVRDEIMGNDIKDIDLCVELPDGGIEFANWLHRRGLLAFPPVVYPTYGTAMFQLAAFCDYPIEVVQTRKEQYKHKNSRNPEVVFGTLKEDCYRRDLTINSLYYNVSKNVYIDLTGKGYNDIEEHIIRTTNVPDIIFQDDPLRVLRVCRFASRYGWEIEKETFEGMKHNVDRLSIITKERIQDEFSKMLTCNNPVMALTLIKNIGAMKYVIPELEETYDMAQNKYHFGTVWEHTLEVVRNIEENDLTLRMAALLHDIGKIRTRSIDDKGNVHFYEHELMSAKMCIDILKRLKYSNDFISDICFLVKNHMLTKQYGDEAKIKRKSLMKLEYRLGDKFEQCMKLIHADNVSHVKEYCMPNQVTNIKKLVEEYKKQGCDMFNYKLPVNGDDIMKELDIPPGKEVKECLNWLLKFAFNKPQITRKELLKNIKQFKN